LSPKLSVIIPTKDEEGAIASLIRDCEKALDGFDHEIIVVDASKDNTSTEAVKAGAKLVKQIGNGGVGQALIQGFYWARGEYIVFFDGDGTYDPADTPALVEPLVNGEADLVNGNRFANMEKGAMTITNKIGNKFLTWIGNLMFYTNIKDSQSGMKAFRRDILKRVTLWERGFPICSEILAEASKLNLRITEVGISYRRRIGKTKLSPTVAGPKILWASLTMLRDYDPLSLFVGIGLALLAIGFLVAWPVITEYLEFGIFRYVGRALVALFCWFSGILSIFTGIMLNAVNYSVKKLEARLTGEK
jgi:glycosyltransferase involved in cell wall biosynthesis